MTESSFLSLSGSHGDNTASARPRKHMCACISFAMVYSSVEHPFEITTLIPWHFFLKLKFAAFNISSPHSHAPSFLDTNWNLSKMCALLDIVSDTREKDVERSPGISWLYQARWRTYFRTSFSKQKGLLRLSMLLSLIFDSSSLLGSSNLGMSKEKSSRKCVLGQLSLQYSWEQYTQGNYPSERQLLFQLSVLEGTVHGLGTFLSPLFGCVLR